MAIKKVKLKGIFTGDFRKSEQTLFNEASMAHGNLRKGEVYMFISRNGDQILWVYKPYAVERVGVHGGRLKQKVSTVIDSRRLRLAVGEWSPMMIQNYSQKVGLWLHTLPRFEVKFTEARD